LLIPVDALSADNFERLAARTLVEAARPGESLFKRGQRDRKRFYVLSGDVVLEVPGQQPRTVRGGSPDAKHPLDPRQPRQANATAKTPVTFIALDEDLLNTMLTWDQSSGLVVDEMESGQGDNEDDWMTRILQTKSFMRVPPANIQAMFMRLKPVAFQAGETVVKQGDPGDFYYIISRGKCAVTRIVPETGKELKLTELKVGDSFGEEALLGDCVRNATVTMVTNGTLMQLSREDFEKLLKAPVLKTVNLEQALDMVKHGAIWLDVRLESEFENDAMDGATNIPLYILRLKMNSIDASKRYIVYCDSGTRSASAAFLLNERGIDVYVLEGGLSTQLQDS
jgi:CRP-like cAMP-binding protein